MPPIITSIHSPAALAFTCRQRGLPAPAEGWAQLDDCEVFGWIVRLPGVLHPIVCDTLTGLVAYHSADNGFERYARIMRFIFGCYHEQARFHRLKHPAVVRTPDICSRT